MVFGRWRLACLACRVKPDAHVQIGAVDTWTYHIPSRRAAEPPQVMPLLLGSRTAHVSTPSPRSDAAPTTHCTVLRAVLSVGYRQYRSLVGVVRCLFMACGMPEQNPKPMQPSATSVPKQVRGPIRLALPQSSRRYRTVAPQQLRVCPLTDVEFRHLPAKIGLGVAVPVTGGSSPVPSGM